MKNKQPLNPSKYIIGFFLFSLLLAVAGLGKILNLLYPAGALGLAWIFYKKHPLAYVTFSWWLLFVTPFIRRLSDYNGSFTDPSPMLLAPFLATIITLVSVYENIPLMLSSAGLPFFLAFIGIGYGYLTSIVQTSPVTATIAVLTWISPIIFSFHVFSKWRDYPLYKKNTERLFVWAVLITGSYGVYQYLVAPDWDTYWLIQTGLFTSMGSPEPMGLRVWSTMHSPLPFATTMIGGLIILFISRSPLRLPASGVGYLSILLTSVRTSWLGWFLSFVILSVSLKSTHQVRLIMTVASMAVLVVPLATVPPFAEMISARLGSFSNMEDDNSLNARQHLYEKTLKEALGTIIGNGIGSSGPGFDSGFLDLLISLGWLGFLPYIAGIAFIFMSVYMGNESSFDPFVAACRAIISGIFPMLLGGSVMVSLSGITFWYFAALNLSAKMYYNRRN